MRTAYAEDHTVFLLFFLAYGLGNWLIFGLSSLIPAQTQAVFICRTIVSLALVGALVA